MANNLTQKIDFVILTAIPEEMSFYKDFFKEYLYQKTEFLSFASEIYLYNNKKILLASTGLGTSFAASVLTLIHQYFSPTYILFSGTAGAINPSLKIRDVVIAETAFEAELQDLWNMVKGTPFETCFTHPLKNETFPLTYSADKLLLSIAKKIMLNKKNIHIGTVVTTNAFPAPLALFEKIKAKEPYCIDMETSALYQTAWLLDISLLVVRGISNTLNHDGTDDNLHESDIVGSSKAAGEVVIAILSEVIAQQSQDKSVDYEFRAPY